MQLARQHHAHPGADEGHDGVVAEVQEAQAHDVRPRQEQTLLVQMQQTLPQFLEDAELVEGEDGGAN